MYADGETELLTIEEMLRRRDRTVEYETVKPARKAPALQSGAAVERFTPGRRVRHGKFGTGVILGVKADKVEIRFEGAYGVKALMLDTVIKNNLIAFI